jgi:hypothetical protein
VLVPIGRLRADASMGVLAIWRYPVKAMLGELLEAVAMRPWAAASRPCPGSS